MLVQYSIRQWCSRCRDEHSISYSSNQVSHSTATSLCNLLFLNLVSNHSIKWSNRTDEGHNEVKKSRGNKTLSARRRNCELFERADDISSNCIIFIGIAKFFHAKLHVYLRSIASTAMTEDVKLIKNLPHKSILSIGEKTDRVFHGLAPPYIERNAFFAFKRGYIRRDCTVHRAKTTRNNSLIRESTCTINSGRFPTGVAIIFFNSVSFKR